METHRGKKRLNFLHRHPCDLHLRIVWFMLRDKHLNGSVRYQAKFLFFLFFFYTLAACGCKEEKRMKYQAKEKYDGEMGSLSLFSQCAFRNNVKLHYGSGGLIRDSDPS